MCWSEWTLNTIIAKERCRETNNTGWQEGNVDGYLCKIWIKGKKISDTQTSCCIQKSLQQFHARIHPSGCENIVLRPKNEVQLAHFSGKQQTLHCTVLENCISSASPHSYMYHLSDDTHHGSILTFYIMESIIQNNLSLIDDGKLVIKSARPSIKAGTLSYKWYNLLNSTILKYSGSTGWLVMVRVS